MARVRPPTPAPRVPAGSGRSTLLTILVCAALVAAGLLVAGPVRAATGGGGWDVSFPQCAGTGAVGLPPAPGMAIVGVNDGAPFSTNPCLAAQVTWAGPGLAAYINTDDPGPGSRLWPAATTAKTHTGPRRCVAVRRSRATIACAFDYGWKAARDAYTRMGRALATVARQPGRPAGLPSSASAMRWWLDVESANWWSRSVPMNTASIAGTLAYLRAVHVQSVGIYANRSDSRTLFATNSPSFGAGTLSWLATGATTLTGGLGLCNSPGFTGAGYTWMVQYWPSSLDADAQCAGYISSLGAESAGTPVPGLRVTLVQPAASATQVTLATSSPDGGFAFSAAGPWTPTLVIPIAAGAIQGRAFVYRDMRAGAPALTASASGIAGRIGRYGLVVAGAPVSIAVTRPSVSLPVGASVHLGISGLDAYGNPVTAGLGAVWGTTPGIIGQVVRGPGQATVFRANAVGSATVRASLGTLSASATVTVTAPPGGAPGAFAGLARLVAGAVSGPVRVRAWAPADAATTTWTVSAPPGSARVATAPTGPWMRSVQVAVPIGQVVSAPIYLRDTASGVMTLTAVGAGGTITASAPVVAGPVAVISVSPDVVHLPVGRSTVLRLAARDAYGNPAPVSGRWSITRPAVAHLAQVRGVAVRVQGRARGATWVIVRAGSRQALVRVIVG